MFLRPFPNRSPVDIPLVKTESTCAHRAFWTNSEPSLCKHVLMLLGASQLQGTGGRVEGLDQTQQTVQQARIEGSSLSPKAAALWSIGESEWAAERGKRCVLPPRSHLESRAWPQGRVAARCPRLPELFREWGDETPFFHRLLCRSSVSTTQIYLDSRREKIRGISSG